MRVGGETLGVVLLGCVAYLALSTDGRVHFELASRLIATPEGSRSVYGSLLVLVCGCCAVEATWLLLQARHERELQAARALQLWWRGIAPEKRATRDRLVHAFLLLLGRSNAAAVLQARARRALHPALVAPGARHASRPAPAVLRRRPGKPAVCAEIAHGDPRA